MSQGSESSHNLLSLLDRVKPLMQCSVEFTEDIYDSVKKLMPSFTFLEYFQYPVKSLHDLSKNYEILIPLVNMIQFQDKKRGSSFMVLDLLTLLVMMVDGPLERKARLLFSWYNSDKSGLMDERQHVIFILRVCSCLRETRLIGLLDITQDDARYLAIEARTRREGDELRFLPGLNFDDFYNWISTNIQCKTVFKFKEVMNRLVDTLSVLERRSAEVLSIMEEKREYHKKKLPILIKNEDDKRFKISSSIIPLSRSQNSLSFCITLTDPTCHEVFIKCEKMVPIRKPLYDIPFPVTNRHQTKYKENSRPGVQCCNKFYLLKSVHRYPLFDRYHWYPDQPCEWIPSQHVEVHDLSPGSQYRVSIYSELDVFRQVETQTMASHRDAVQVCVLPASLSVAQAGSYLVNDEFTHDYDAVIFSGSVCPVDQIIKPLLLHLSDNSVSLNSIYRLSAVLTSCASSCYRKSWCKYAGNLSKIVNSCPEINTSELSWRVNPTQLLCYNGAGPLVSPAVTSSLKKVLPVKLFRSFLAPLEDLHSQYMKSLLTHSPQWRSGPLRVFFLHSKSDVEKKDGNSTMSINQVVTILYDLIIQDSMRWSEAQHIVLLVRSPDDLMEVTPDLNSGKGQGSKEQELEEKKKEREELTNMVEEDIRLINRNKSVDLTGRYEIIHGEYSSALAFNQSSAPVLEKPLVAEEGSKAEDRVFQSFVKAAFAWLSCSPRHSDNNIATSESEVQSNINRTISVVSCNWREGVNFELGKKVEEGENYLKVRFESLLSTFVAGKEKKKKPSDDAETLKDVDKNETSKLLSRIGGSLSEGVDLEITASSDTRALHFISDQPEGPLVFRPLNIKEKSNDENFNFSSVQSSAQVTHGPSVCKVSSDEALLSAGAEGRGVVTCTLYEIPVHINHEDLIAIVVTPVERKKLRVVSLSSRFVVKRRELLFRFSGLTPYCCYAAVIDSTMEREPVAATFRTSAQFSSLVSSTFLSSMVKGDVAGPSFRVSKISRLIQSFRSPVASTFFLDCVTNALVNRFRRDGDMGFVEKMTSLHHSHFGRHVNRTITAPLSRDSDEKKKISSSYPNLLQKDGNVGEKEDDLSEVNVCCQGYFCFITLKKDDVGSLSKVVDALKWVRHREEIRLIVLFSSKPLLRYLRRHSADSSWISDSHFAENRSLCSEIFQLLLAWKGADTLNDCKIISFADVSAAVCYEIRHSYDVDHIGARYDKLSTETNKVSGKGETLGGFEPSLTEAPSLRQPSASTAESSEFHRNVQGVKFNESMDMDGELSVVEVINVGDDFSLGGDQPAGVLRGTVSLGYTDRNGYQPSASFNSVERRLLVSFHHLILPLYLPVTENAEVGAQLMLPKGVNRVDEVLEYEKLEKVWDGTGMHFIPPSLDLYTGSAPLLEKEPLIYRIDALLEVATPSEVSALAVQYSAFNSFRVPPDFDHPGTALDRANWLANQSFVTADGASSAVTSNTMHSLFIRAIVDERDLVEVTLGPVVGKVRDSTARILLEVNQDLKELTCTLKPKSRDREETKVEVTVEDVEAYQLLVFDFSGLVSGKIYEIFLSDICGNKALGRLRTSRPFQPYAQFAVSGETSLRDQPIIMELVNQIRHQQFPQLMELTLLNSLLLEGDRSPAAAVMGAKKQNKGEDGKWGAFENLASHLKVPGVSTTAVFHLGSLCMLSECLFELVLVLLDNAKKLEVPLRDASLVGKWYYRQFEELVKDTFRVFWSTPAVKELFSLSSTIPLYHSQYLLPLSRLSKLHPEAKELSVEDVAIMQIIRKVFTAQLKTYVSSLYKWEEGDSSHFNTWQQDSLVVAQLDTNSGRSRLKTEVEGDPEEDPAERKVESKLTFSLGFLDKTQWRELRKVTTNPTLTHLVILTEKPIIPLGSIPLEFTPPKSLEKGEVLDWAPTLSDLEVFLQTWMDWMAMHHNGLVAATRSVVLVSASDIPYSTVVQDLKSGLKVHQMCVANYKRTVNAMTETEKLKHVVASGKIGSLRYRHQLEEQDYCEIDPTRGESNATSGAFDHSNVAAAQEALARGETKSSMNRDGYAILRLWFDSWKPVGVWASDPMLGGEPTEFQDALILIGPVVGAPIVVKEYVAEEEKEVMRMMVPVLLEMDRRTALTIEVVELFNQKRMNFHLRDVPAKRPVVVELGPLEVGTRYNVRITKGLKPTPFSVFSFSTHLNWDETNVIVMNDQVLQDTQCASELLIDVADRCRVPFNGIAVTVHTNFQPDLTAEIEEFMGNEDISRGLAACRRTGQLDPSFRTDLENVIQVFRERFRSVFGRPTFREVMRNGFHLLMQHLTPVQIDLTNVDYTEELLPVYQLLQLIIARLNQEYFDKLRSPHVNVFRAIELTEEMSEDKSNSYPREESVGGLSGYQQETEDDVSLKLLKQKVGVKFLWTKAKMEPLDAVMEQWFCKCIPAPYRWEVWVSPNERVSVEQFRCVTEENVEELVEQIANSPVVSGTRLVVVHENISKEDDFFVETLAAGSEAHMHRFYWALHQWKNGRDPLEAEVLVNQENLGPILIEEEKAVEVGEPKDNDAISDDASSARFDKPQPMNDNNSEVPLDQPELEEEAPVIEEEPKAIDKHFCVIYPSGKLGTTAVEVNTNVSGIEESSIVFFLASSYHSIDFELAKRRSELDRDAQATKKKMKSAVAKSKRAQKQLEEEEQRRLEKVAEEVGDFRKGQKPDGYLLIECRTDKVVLRSVVDEEADVKEGMLTTAPFITIVNRASGSTSTKGSVSNSAEELSMPSHYEFLQLPKWLAKFAPMTDAVFVQDEVVLITRQRPDSQLALNTLDSGTLLPTFVTAYEQSRLSELSRPEDLREVNMSVPGIVDLFFKDLVAKIWAQYIPPNLKKLMLPLDDDFVRGVCFSRTVSDEKVLASSKSFALAYQTALILSLQLKAAMHVSTMEAFQYILRKEDPASETVNKIEKKETQKRKKKEAKELEDRTFEALEAIINGPPEDKEEEIIPQITPREVKIPTLEEIDLDLLAEVEKDGDDRESDILELNKEQGIAEGENLEEDDGADDDEEESFNLDDDDDEDDDDDADESLEKGKGSSPVVHQKKEIIDDDDEAGKEQGGAEVNEKEMMDELYRKRQAWQRETLERIETTLEEELVFEAVKQTVADMYRECKEVCKRIATEEERVEEAKRHVRRVRRERKRVRREVGKKLAFMSGK